MGLRPHLIYNRLQFICTVYADLERHKSNGVYSNIIEKLQETFLKQMTHEISLIREEES